MKRKAIKMIRGLVNVAAPLPENKIKMRAFLDDWLALANKREKEKGNEQHPTERHPKDTDTAHRA